MSTGRGDEYWDLATEAENKAHMSSIALVTKRPCVDEFDPDCQLLTSFMLILEL